MQLPNLLSGAEDRVTGHIGIGALPVHVAARDVADGRLRQLSATANLPAIDIQLVTSPARSRNRAEAVLSQMLAQEIADVPLAERSYG